MSYIVRTGNLASTPELREGERGAYTYARVLVTDRIKNGEEWADGPAIAYDVSISGAQATALVDTATRCGHVRVTFAGDYRVNQWTTDQGETRITHQVRADEVGISLRGQTVTVEPRN